jgi:hypothetical protein
LKATVGKISQAAGEGNEILKSGGREPSGELPVLDEERGVYFAGAGVYT